MRYMVIGKATADTEQGVLPTERELAEMGAYNEELVKAGVLLTAEGLLPSSKGALVRFDENGRTTVVDGPFAETKELIAGFCILEVSSREEAVEWVRKSPIRDAEVEIRQIFSPEDFGEALTPELREQTERRRATAAAQHAS
jgi:hypothetical protein